MEMRFTYVFLLLVALCYPILGQINEDQSQTAVIPGSSVSKPIVLLNETSPEILVQHSLSETKEDDKAPNTFYVILAASLMVILSLITLIWMTKGIATAEKEGINAIIRLGFADILIAVAGLTLWWVTLSRAMIVITPIILAYVTFFGFMSISQAIGGDWALNRGGMRGAITSCIIVVYFFIVSMAIFNTFRGEIPIYMQTITENFTTTMGIVIAFYFGASAYVQTHEKDKGRDT
jgi:hypothetical protein